GRRNYGRKPAATARCSICRHSASMHPKTRRAKPMTSSPNGKRQVRDDLPPGLPSIWRLCKLGYRHEPGMLLAAFLMSLFAALPDSLVAVWFKVLGDGLLQRRRGLVLGAAIGLGVSATATWFLRTVSTRVHRRFRDKVTS